MKHDYAERDLTDDDLNGIVGGLGGKGSSRGSMSPRSSSRGSYGSSRSARGMGSMGYGGSRPAQAPPVRGGSCGPGGCR